MRTQKLQKTVSILLPLVILLSCLFFFFTSSVAYASGDLTTGDSPELVDMLGSVAKIINFAIAFSGVVFAIMIGFGAIKLASALGDPKGLQAAGQTWTFAFIGVFLVLGSLTIIFILGKMFGITDLLNPNTLVLRSKMSIEDFVKLMSGGGTE